MDEGLSPFDSAVRSNLVTRPRGARPEFALVPGLGDEANEKVDGAKRFSLSFLRACPGGNFCCEQCQPELCGYPRGGRDWRNYVRGRGRVWGECACRISDRGQEVVMCMHTVIVD